MIQSSQPMSLKLTWSRRRWQRGLDLAAWCCGRTREGARRGFLTVLLSSRFLLFPNARRNAFSLLVLPSRAKPRVRRSSGRPPRCSRASSSKHSCCPPRRSSTVLDWSRAAFCRPEAQLYSFNQGTEPPSAAATETGFLRMRSSAPRSPSRSRELIDETEVRSLFLLTTPLLPSSTARAVKSTLEPDRETTSDHKQACYYRPAAIPH
uniref:Uncharacterized protein n=1 Tax=Poecilia mexicana TaxID=48701 RepID=A0A3B3X718_9TELE